jgi:hypothetical protein
VEEDWTLKLYEVISNTSVNKAHNNIRARNAEIDVNKLNSCPGIGKTRLEGEKLPFL